VYIAELFWVLIGCLWVARCVEWLPTRLADEDNFAISQILFQNSSDKNTSVPSALDAPLLSFFSSLPSRGLATTCYACATAIIAVWAYMIYGPGLSFVAWTIFGWGLLVLASVDYRTKLLPDVLTLPLLWLGIVIQLFPETRTIGIELSVIGAVAGYLPLWLLAQAYRLIRGRDGLGMGDLKLLAAMGAWSGPFILPQVLLLAALLAIAVFVIERLVHRSAGGFHEERPFGPAIVAAYFIVLIFMR
jgi:prepilin signal peptidase PulO-like enzyme (type II secretory pathway)